MFPPSPSRSTALPSISRAQLAEALQYDAIFWQDFDRQRQMHAFDKVARIYVLSVFAKDGGDVLV